MKPRKPRDSKLYRIIFPDVDRYFFMIKLGKESVAVSKHDAFKLLSWLYHAIVYGDHLVKTMKGERKIGRRVK